jgi:DNA-binding transcriptional regulator YhcF (GntR family)
VTGETPAVEVDTLSPVPPYEQVRAQLAELVSGGVLGPDDRLPPIRQLAADLGIAPGTVARAYRLLESAGLVRTGRGGGTRVVADPPVPLARADLSGPADTYVRAGRDAGAEDGELLAAVRSALRRSRAAK